MTPPRVDAGFSFSSGGNPFPVEVRFPAPVATHQCKAIFKDDGLSGATTKRPSLLRCLKKLEHSQTLIVWKLDRRGRSLRFKFSRPSLCLMMNSGSNSPCRAFLAGHIPPGRLG